MTLLVIVSLVLILTAGGVANYLLAGGGPRRGLASGFDVHRTLSVQAHRRRAAVTRPGTTVDRHTPASEVGIEICRRGRKRLLASLEEVVLVFAPPRAGKTALISNHVIDAPGACVATSTKPDIYTLTQDRRGDRPVHVFNPDGLGDIPSTLRWSPITGCGNPDEAMMRAGYLISGAQVAKGNAERSFWNGNAHRALRCHLMAAALTDRTMHDVVHWTQRLQDEVPVRILRTHPSAPPGWADELERIGGLPDRTRESIAVTLTSAVAFMSDPALADAATPGPDDTTFDPVQFLRAHGTLYLLGKQREYGAVGPLFAALTGHLFETAQKVAARFPGGRLNPPLTGVLDEAALICRLPLERLTADCGGRGIPLVISIQGPDQLFDVWGEDAGRIIWTNATMKVAFGGLSVGKHLAELSDLCGTRIERKSGKGGNGQSLNAERVPVLRPDEIRELPDFTVLVLYRNLGAVIGRVRPVWTRRDKHPAAGQTGPLARIYWLADYRRTRQNRRRAS